MQSLIARALDEDKHCIMASIDLSSAFDVVNYDLLLKRLRVVGLPADLVALVEIWLKNRNFYVKVNGRTSIFFWFQLKNYSGFYFGACPLSNLCCATFWSNGSFQLCRWQLHTFKLKKQNQCNTNSHRKINPYYKMAKRLRFECKWK